jgi:glycosyltransferase involved in cell wall biosynthesis
MSRSKLRVLHVLEATLGGTRRYIEDIAVTTADAPLEQGLIYGTSRSDSAFGQLLERVRETGWSLTSIDVMRRPVNAMNDARAVAQVRRVISDFRPHVLHVHSAKGGAIGRLAMLLRGSGAPRVVYSPHALPSRLDSSYMAMAAERVLAALTKRFIAVSDSEGQEIVAEGLATHDRIDVVYPRIDTAHFSPRDRDAARLELDLPPDVPIVMGIGRLAAQKDPLSFVTAIARLRAHCPAAIGVWVGDGELRSQVEAKAADLRLGSALRIVGWITDIRPYIAAADAILSTSRYESFGYVIPEAFAMKRPVVASRVTGTVDVFYPAAQTLLYEPDRLDDAVSSLKRLIDDRGFSEDLSALGRLSVINRFSKAAMLASLSQSYDRAVSAVKSIR